MPFTLDPGAIVHERMCAIRPVLVRRRQGILRPALEQGGARCAGVRTEQRLEEWAALKIGAAILPKSKVTSRYAYPIEDNAGRYVTIAFEAVWVGGAGRPEHRWPSSGTCGKSFPGSFEAWREE